MVRVRAQLAAHRIGRRHQVAVRRRGREAVECRVQVHVEGHVEVRRLAQLAHLQPHGMQAATAWNAGAAKTRAADCNRM